ncbi:MAG: SPOR domain-containing protein [Bryobacteraceae bacterium]
MPRNDDGEFELVLGNRQLLSGFFIVVILFGVFFTMGYIVGRHSSPPASAASAANGSVAPAPAKATPLAPGQVEVISAEKKAEPEKPAAKPPVTTQPVQPSPSGQTAATPPEPSKPSAPPAEEASGAPKLAEPAPGETYLQVAAPKRGAADGVIEALRKKGITAVLGPGPDADTVRVLVGPVKDSTMLGKLRADLEGAGFKPFVRKY